MHIYIFYLNKPEALVAEGEFDFQVDNVNLNRITCLMFLSTLLRHWQAIYLPCLYLWYIEICRETCL